MRAAGSGMHDVLERVNAAADLVVVSFLRKDAFQNAAMLQKSCFRAKQHTGMLPLNVRSVFFVDGGFIGGSCRPNDRGVRHIEYQDTGTCVAAIRRAIPCKLKRARAADNVRGGGHVAVRARPQGWRGARGGPWRPPFTPARRTPGR